MFGSKAFKNLFLKSAPKVPADTPDLLMSIRNAGGKLTSDHLGKYTHVLDNIRADSGDTYRFDQGRFSNHFNRTQPGIDTPIPSRIINLDAPLSPLDSVVASERYGSVLEMGETELAVTTRLSGVAEALAPLAEAEEVAVVGAESGALASSGALAAAGPIMAGIAGVLLLVAGGYAIYKHFQAKEPPPNPVSINAPLEVGPGPGFQRMDDRSGGYQSIHRDIRRLWSSQKQIQKYFRISHR